MRIKSYRDLIVWQQAMDLVDATYRASSSFPRTEDYALTGQMRRSAISIPSNIAEGGGRGTDRDQCVYLRVALGSLHELSTQVEIAFRVGYLGPDVQQELSMRIVSIDKLLVRLLASLQNDQLERDLSQPT